MTASRSPARARILVVEDEPYVRTSLDELLHARGFDVDLAPTAEAAMTSLGRSPVDAVLTDLRLPGTDGLRLVQWVRTSFPDLPIVVLTGYGTVPSAVECVRAGANDYILKPADPDALEIALERALTTHSLKRQVRYLRDGSDGADETGLPIGESPAWIAIMKTVRAAAVTDSTVLLLGESGTGKELLARMIHRLGRRAVGPYIQVNCSAIPLEMWESEFFGHRRGAFTGAASDRDGRFRLAHRGTLFMDEVGAMPLAAQAKILRAVQDGEFHRLGDEDPTRVDVRMVAATNSDLDAEVSAGRFRQDLFYRLNVMRIEVPPLRRRLEDIPLLAARFAREISARLGRRVPALAPELLGEMKAYAWPGNVRELRNVIERALILDPGDSLVSVDLPSNGVTPGGGSRTDGHGSSAADALNLRAAISGREKEILLEALRRSGGVRKEAARLLGVDQRNLAYYFRKHAIDPDLPSE